MKKNISGGLKGIGGSMMPLVAWMLVACGGSQAPTTEPSPSTPPAPAESAAEARPSATEDTVPTWDGFVSGFSQKYCVSCHGTDEKLKDYSVRENVVAVAAAIRCGVTPKEEPLSDCDHGTIPAGIFPVGDGPKPSDEERRLFLRWIDSGMP